MTTRPNKRFIDTYKKMHWGLPADRIIEVRDPDYPEHMVQMGNLVELRVQRTAQGQPSRILTDPRRTPLAHLAWDPTHPHQRLYIVTQEPERQGAKRAFWNPRGVMYSLADLAALVRGHHAMRDYPTMAVQPIGVLTHVCYVTSKLPDWEEDGRRPSNYIHEMGEEGGHPPILAVDSIGRLWIAGGTYTVEEGGIAN